MMKKRTDNKILLSSIVCLLPMIVSLLIYKTLPNELPIHFNFKGDIDGYSSKFFVCILMPCILCILNLVLIFITIQDPKKNGHHNSFKNIIYFVIPSLSIIVSSISILSGLKKTIDVKTIMILFISILFLIIGNYMPKLRHNYTIGIRTPWTLNNKDNWHSTHRFSGKLWFIFGILNILTCLLINNIAIYVFLPSIILVSIIPIIYSLIYYKLHHK